MLSERTLKRLLGDARDLLCPTDLDSRDLRFARLIEAAVLRNARASIVKLDTKVDDLGRLYVTLEDALAVVDASRCAKAAKEASRG